VRLVGYVYTRGPYGHGSAYDGELVATRITFLDTPGCDPSSPSR
jgi:hypothetical protein